MGLSNNIAGLILAIKTNIDVRRAWQANIAMNFVDAYSNYFDPLTEDSGEIHESAMISNIANNAANNFLSQLCNENFERAD